jgi:ribose-phosphate pyrophosphokinase
MLFCLAVQWRGSIIRSLDELVVTDTIPLRDDASASTRIRQLSVANLMAETIRRISDEDSVSSLFSE